MENFNLIQHAPGAPGLRIFGLGPKYMPQNGIKKLQSFCEYKDRDNDKAWTVLTSSKEIDLDNKMYQFDTTAEIGKNIYRKNLVV